MESGGFLSRSVEVCRVAVELSGAILSSSLSSSCRVSCRVVEARAQVRDPSPDLERRRGRTMRHDGRMRPARPTPGARARKYSGDTAF